MVLVFRPRVDRTCLLRRLRCLGAYGVRGSTVRASSRHGLSVGKTNSALRARVCRLQVRVMLGSYRRGFCGLFSAFGPNPTLKSLVGGLKCPPGPGFSSLRIPHCSRGFRLNGLLVGTPDALGVGASQRTISGAHNGSRYTCPPGWISPVDIAALRKP